MSKETKPAPTIKAMKVLDAIYDDIGAAIDNLKANLENDEPGAAGTAWHDQVWDVELYSAIQADVAIIGSLLALLETLKIPVRLKDVKFEETAQHWASI